MLRVANAAVIVFGRSFRSFVWLYGRSTSVILTTQHTAARGWRSAL